MPQFTFGAETSTLHKVANRLNLRDMDADKVVDLVINNKSTSDTDGDKLVK